MLKRDDFAILLIAVVSLPFLYDNQLPKWALVFCLLFHALRGWDEVDTVTLGAALYAGASLAWSPDWQTGSIAYAKLLGLAGVFLLARRTLDIRRGLVWACAGALFLALLLPDIHGGFWNENFIAEFLVVCLPFVPWWLGVVSVGYLVGVNEARSEYAAFTALGLARLWFIHPKAAVIGSIGVVVLAIGVAAIWQPYPVMVRLEIWTNTIAMWLERPWAGVGLGGFEHYYHSFANADQRWFGTSQTRLNEIGLTAGSAHNEFIEGLAVFGLGGLVIFAAWWRAYLAKRFLRPRETSCLIMGLALCAIGFPLQNPASAVVLAWALGRVVPYSPALPYGVLPLSPGLRSRSFA